MQLGTASIDITPPAGTPMASSLQPRASVGVDDPLLCKTMVLGNDETRIALVTLDLIAWTRRLHQQHTPTGRTAPWVELLWPPAAVPWPSSDDGKRTRHRPKLTIGRSEREAFAEVCHGASTGALPTAVSPVQWVSDVRVPPLAPAHPRRPHPRNLGSWPSLPAPTRTSSTSSARPQARALLKFVMSRWASVPRRYRRASRNLSTRKTPSTPESGALQAARS